MAYNSNEHNIFFTADTHFYSKNIIKHCNRPFSSVEEMDEILIQNWNNKVSNSDHIYILGDLIWGTENYRTYISRLNGQKHLILGNHDTQQVYKKLLIDGLIQEIKQVKGITIDSNYIWLSHYCHRTWNASFHNSFHLFGHCLDEESEILTNRGWLSIDDITKEDRVINLNKNTGILEENSINEIIDKKYTGDMYYIKGKGTNLNLTSNHLILGLNWNKTKYVEYYASETKKASRRILIKSGQYSQSGIPLQDDYLRLLIWITADGSLCNKDLIRFRFTKGRKIKRLESILNRLNITYKKYVYDNVETTTCGDTSINFTLPKELNNFRLKPLDNKLINCTQEQLEVILEEYSNTDGYKSHNNIMIYTSKKEEADILQELCIRNNYMCNINQRENHGFSKGVNYELAVIKGTYRILNTSVENSVINNYVNYCKDHMEFNGER